MSSGELKKKQLKIYKQNRPNIEKQAIELILKQGDYYTSHQSKYEDTASLIDQIRNEIDNIKTCNFDNINKLYTKIIKVEKIQKD